MPKGHLLAILLKESLNNTVRGRVQAHWALDPSLEVPYGAGPQARWALGPSLEIQYMTLSPLDLWP